jgi:predicted permease
VYVVTPGYLNAMGMHLRAGRDIAWTDAGKSENVIIINEAAARREWPGQDPIGKLAQGVGDGDTRVVGVVGDVHESGVETASSPEVYVPATQNEPAGAELVVRSSLPLDVLTPGVMSILRSINPGQPAVEFRPIQSIVDRSTSPRRFFAILVGLFAALGLLLASLGIYGVISYSVTRQTQEIGIRMALGATRERVQMDVITKTLRLAIAGIIVGTIASLAVAKGISSLLFGTEPTDPLTFIGMILLLIAVAFAAGYIPAWRASRINPMNALRSN